MGYRNYFTKIEKKHSNKIRNLSLEEILKNYVDEDDYVDDKDLLKEKYVFEFGKLYWDDTSERIKSKCEPYFKDENIYKNSNFEDGEYYLANKETVKEAIDIYNNKIKKYYEELKDNVSKIENYEDKFELLNEDIRQKIYEWKNDMALNLKEDNDNICNSCLFEYEIFELVHLYKTFDFEKYDLLYRGW